MYKRRARSLSRPGKRFKRSFRRKTWARRAASRARISRIAKSVVLSTAEKKYKSVQLPVEDSELVSPYGYALYHNKVMKQLIIDNTVGSAILPVQGDGETQRNGDEIYCKGFKYRATLNIPPEMKQSTFALYMVEYNTVQGEPDVYNNLFHNITGETRLDPIDNDKFRVRKIAVYRNRSTDSEAAERVEININKWIPYKRKFKFKGDNTNVISLGMKEKFAFLWMPYDTSDLANTNVCAYLKSNMTIYYADP